MIRKRLILALIVQLFLVLLFSGFYLQYRLQNVLEKELGSKLQSLAGSVAAQLDASLLTLLAPGDETTRLYRGMRQRLTDIAQSAELGRIMVFSDEGKVWLDSEAMAPIGSDYVRNEFDRAEIIIAQGGKSTSSVLFRGQDGGLYKSGYVPLISEGRVAGIVMVEGSARSLKTIRDMQRTLIQIGIVAALLSIGFALAISYRITKPVIRLQQAAKRIGRGEMERPIAIDGRDEVAFLAKTMEEMRRAILQRVEQQKAMLAGVAHEIRNPLGGIELFAGLLRDELKDEALRQKADRILAESKNLKTLVQNFLDFARPAIPKPESCRVKDALADCRELLQNELAANKVRVGSEGDARLFVDPQHLKQMLLNLMLNGIQAMNDGGEIVVRVHRQNSQVAIDVMDQGRGIEPADRENIFTPFFSRRERGLGLGLAMVKMLAEANGGSIQLLKSDSSGTWFRLNFPAAQ